MAKNLHIAGSIGGKSPTKLSDLENDLFYSKRTPFLTITEKDCEPLYGTDDSGNNTDEILGYQYFGSPKLDWLKSLDDIYIRADLSSDPDGTGTNVKRSIFNQTMLTDIGRGPFFEYSEETDVSMSFFKAIYLFNGFNLETGEFIDGFIIAIEAATSFTIEIFKVEEKQIETKTIVDWEECHSDAPGFVSNKPFGIVCESSELFSFVELKDESTAVPKTLDPFNVETEYFAYIGDVKYPVEVKSTEDGTTYLEIAVDDSSIVQIYTDRIVGPVGLQVSLGCYNKTTLELDPKYVPSKMNVENPVGTGSFSMNRKEGTVIGGNSHTEGSSTTASGDASHAEGSDTIASGGSSHAEGSDTKATQAFSHAEGKITTASGIASHTEGANTKAAGDYSHAEGFNTEASGESSHSEGYSSKALGQGSHVEGTNTAASGRFSHAEGYGTKALSNNQHVQGKYNVSDSDSKYAHIIGNGDSDSARSNAHTLDWAGNGWFAGNLYVGGTGQDDANVKKLATEEYVAKSLPNTLPNPSALTIKQGDTEVSYDGSDPLTVEIPSGAVGTPGADGKSAYQYAVEGGYAGTETEFAAKLAAELPDALPNPSALTFTGAVSAIYDGSAPCSVDIPSGGGDGVLKYYNMDITDLASGTIPSGTEPSCAHTGITFGQLNEYSRIRITINNPTTSPVADWAITQGTDTTAWKRIGLTKDRGYLELVKVANHCWEARSLSNRNVGAVGWGGSPHNPYLIDNTGTVLIGSILNFSTIQDSEICIYNISKVSADANWFIHGLN